MVDAVYEKKEDIISVNEGSLRKVAIRLSSIDKKEINRTTRELYDYAATMSQDIELPIIYPVEEACFTTRKSPCGNGTATYSRIKLRVHQRQFNLMLTDNDISNVLEFLNNSPVQAYLDLPQ